MVKSVALNGRIKLLPEGCAVLDNDTMVIADLHLGYEGVVATTGLFMPRITLQDVREKIESALSKEESIRRLVVNGDLKHEFSELHRFEWKDVNAFIKYAKDRFDEFVVVRGNHDNYLKLILKKHGVDFYEQSYTMGDFIITHGDKLFLDVFSRKYIVVAHEHPAMVIRDSVNVKVKVPCFLFGAKNKHHVLVLPAFSPIFPGTDILSVPESALLSPVIRRVGIENMKIYACVEDEILEFPSVDVVRRQSKIF